MIDQEIKQEVIILYQQGLSSYQIGEKFNIGASSVRRILQQNNIVCRPEGANPVPENIAKQIVDLYQQNISSEKIAKQFDINGSTVCRILKRHNIPIRSSIDNKRTYKLNKTWLDNIDSEDKAYFLGLMWSDGNVHKNLHNFKLGLLEPDENLLIYFSKIFYCGVDRVKRHKIPNEKTFCVLYIYSIELVKKLVALGCMPNKTFKTTFPKWLDENLHRHFIRGLIDGDGCININKNGKPIIDFTGTIELIKDIEKMLLENLNIDLYLYKRHKTRDNNIYSFRIYGFNKIERFLNWIYKDSTIFMKRKHSKYLEFLKLYDEFCKKQFSNNEIQNICDLHQKGITTNAIAKLLNKNSGTIYKVLKRENKL